MANSALAALTAFVVSLAPAQTPAAASPKQELDALVAQIQQKLRADEKSPAQLAAEVNAFAALRAKYADSDPAARPKATGRRAGWLVT